MRNVNVSLCNFLSIYMPAWCVCMSGGWGVGWMYVWCVCVCVRVYIVYY